jgi:hypothetical protein
MIYTHVLDNRFAGVRSPLDDLLHEATPRYMPSGYLDRDTWAASPAVARRRYAQSRAEAIVPTNQLANQGVRKPRGSRDRVPIRSSVHL